MLSLFCVPPVDADLDAAVAAAKAALDAAEVSEVEALVGHEVCRSRYRSLAQPWQRRASDAFEHAQSAALATLVSAGHGLDCVALLVRSRPLS